MRRLFELTLWLGSLKNNGDNWSDPCGNDWQLDDSDWVEFSSESDWLSVFGERTNEGDEWISEKLDRNHSQ